MAKWLHSGGSLSLRPKDMVSGLIAEEQNDHKADTKKADTKKADSGKVDGGKVDSGKVDSGGAK